MIGQFSEKLVPPATLTTLSSSMSKSSLLPSTGFNCLSVKQDTFLRKILSVDPRDLIKLTCAGSAVTSNTVHCGQWVTKTKALPRQRRKSAAV